MGGVPGLGLRAAELFPIRTSRTLVVRYTEVVAAIRRSLRSSAPYQPACGGRCELRAREGCTSPIFLDPSTVTRELLEIALRVWSHQRCQQPGTARITSFPLPTGRSFLGFLILGL